MLIRWPVEAEAGARFAAAGVPVLYLVEPADEPPTPATCVEDWIRIPGEDRDLRARIAALELRAAAHRAPPHVDADGLLHYGGRVAPVPNEAVAFARLLAERFGEVVPDAELIAHDADGGEPLRGRMSRLRSELRPFDLQLHRVRRRGYRLQRR